MNHLIIDTETTGVKTNYSKPTKKNPDGLSMTPGEPFDFVAGHSQPYMVGLLLLDEDWNIVRREEFTFAPESVRRVLERMTGHEITADYLRDSAKDNDALYRQFHLLDAEGNIHPENLDNPQPFEFGAAEVSGVSVEDVNESPTYAEQKIGDVIREMATGDTEITAYNADFDVKMICYEAELSGDNDIKSLFFDKDGHRTYQDAMANSMEKIGLDRNLKLEELYTAVAIDSEGDNRLPHSQGHTALEDAVDTAYCLREMDKGHIPTKKEVIQALEECRADEVERVKILRDQVKTREDLPQDEKIHRLYLSNERENTIRFALDTKLDHFLGREPKLEKTMVEDPGYTKSPDGKREVSYIEAFGINGDGNSFRYNSKTHKMTPDDFGMKPAKSLGNVIERAAKIRGVSYQQAKDGYRRLIEKDTALPYRYAKREFRIEKPKWSLEKFVSREAAETVRDYGSDEWGQKLPNTFVKAAGTLMTGRTFSGAVLDAARYEMENDREGFERIISGEKAKTVEAESKEKTAEAPQHDKTTHDSAESAVPSPAREEEKTQAQKKSEAKGSIEKSEKGEKGRDIDLSDLKELAGIGKFGKGKEDIPFDGFDMNGAKDKDSHTDEGRKGHGEEKAPSVVAGGKNVNPEAVLRGMEAMAESGVEQLRDKDGNRTFIIPLQPDVNYNFEFDDGHTFTMNGKEFEKMISGKEKEQAKTKADARDHEILF